MKKKLLALMAVSMLAAALPVGASALYDENGDNTPPPEGTAAITSMAEPEPDTPSLPGPGFSQDKALGAYTKLMEAFSASYPESYGGGYIDGETLVVLLTDMDAADAYREICGEYSDAVRFEQVEYSYTELLRAMDTLNADLSGTDGIAGFGPDERKNCIFIDALKSAWPDPNVLTAKIESLISIPYRVNWVDGYAVATDGSDSSGKDTWTDPETGYVYENGVNVTVQGDIMLLSETGEDIPEAEPVANVPKTGVSSSGMGLALGAAAGLGLLKKKRNK